MGTRHTQRLPDQDMDAPVTMPHAGAAKLRAGGNGDEPVWIFPRETQWRSSAGVNPVQRRVGRIEILSRRTDDIAHHQTLKAASVLRTMLAGIRSGGSGLGTSFKPVETSRR